MRDGNQLAGWQSGSCRGLQILVHRFNSGTGLQKVFTVFRLSSAVEQSAVNRLVACSNQAAGANKKSTLLWVLFLLVFALLLDRRPTGACSKRIVGARDFKKRKPYSSRRTRLREYLFRQPEPSHIFSLAGLFFGSLPAFLPQKTIIIPLDFRQNL